MVEPKEEEPMVQGLTTKVSQRKSWPRKLKSSRGPNSKRTLRSSTPRRRSRRWGSADRSAESVRTSTGDTVKLERLVETRSNGALFTLPCSCEGTYSFIGKGIGKGKQITFAEAWQGILPYLSIFSCRIRKESDISSHSLQINKEVPSGGQVEE